MQSQLLNVVQEVSLQINFGAPVQKIVELLGCNFNIVVLLGHKLL